jgi:hypothetical protein
MKKEKEKWEFSYNGKEAIKNGLLCEFDLTKKQQELVKLGLVEPQEFHHYGKLIHNRLDVDESNFDQFEAQRVNFYNKKDFDINEIIANNFIEDEYGSYWVSEFFEPGAIIPEDEDEYYELYDEMLKTYDNKDKLKIVGLL